MHIYTLHLKANTGGRWSRVAHALQCSPKFYLAAFANSPKADLKSAFDRMHLQIWVLDMCPRLSLNTWWRDAQSRLPNLHGLLAIPLRKVSNNTHSMFAL